MKALLSLGIVFSTLLSIVVFKIEIRRLTYRMGVMESSLIEKRMENRNLKADLAAIQRPQHVREYATSKWTLDWAKKNQIIYITGDSDANLSADNNSEQ